MQDGKNRDFYFKLFDEFPCPIWRSRVDAKCDYVNQAWLSFTGRTIEQELGDGWTEGIHPEDRDRCLTTALEAFNSRETCEIEYRLRHSTGEYRWVSDVGRPFYDLDGNFVGYIGVCFDISERKRAEASLKLFGTLIDQSSDAIEVIDPRTLRFLDCNESAHQSLGYSREEFLTMSVFDIDPNVDELMAAPVVAEMKRSGFAMFESIHRRKDGSTFPVEVNVKQIQLERAYRLAVVRDITERRRAEMQLSQNEIQMTEAQRLARVGSWEWNIATNELTWSEELYRICALDPEKFRPSHEAFKEILDPSCRDEIITEIEMSVANGQPLNHYPRIVRPDGEVRILHSRGKIDFVDGKPFRMFGAAQDVTEQELAEKALREAEQRYRNIFENAGEGIFQSTPDGRFITANPALARMHGFDSPEELIRNLNDISRQVYVEPNRREEFKRLLAEYDVVRGVEHQVFRRDGSKIWISVNARVVRDDHGSILYYEGTAKDITGRIQAQVRSAAFATLARKLSGARTQLDAGRIIAETAGELFGWDACKLDLYDSDRDLISPMLNVDAIGGRQVDVTADIPRRKPTARSRRVIDHGPELILREEPVRFDEDAIPFGDKSRPSASIMIVPIRHALRVIGLLSIQSYTPHAYDETALNDLQSLADHCSAALNRIRAEAALRESEERYRKLFENSKDTIYVHDLKGFYTSVNRAGEKLYGYTRAEIIGKHFADFVPPEEMNRVSATLRKKLDEAGETVYEVDMIAKDGRRVPVEISSRVIYENGVAVAIQGTARDITDRRRAEEERESAHKASKIFSRRLIEAQEAERQSIARELHDEIGQVLTAVRMNLQSVSHACAVSAALPHVEESIVIVDEALGRVQELSLDLRPSLLDDLGLNAALRWYVNRYARRTAIVAEVASDSESGDRLPHELETACFRIAQEALTNVARHSQAGYVSVQLERLGETLLLTIVDNGVGFDVRGLLGTSASSLGLNGMEERARAVGGRVVIDSAPGEGTRLRASFPLKRQDNQFGSNQGLAG